MDFSKINELKPYDLNCNIFDVYSYNGLSMQELLCQFFTKINECIKTSNETIDLAEWLVNEGLKQEVSIKLTNWLNDGTLENVINVTLFENLNNKIDNVSSQLAHIENIINIETAEKMKNGNLIEDDICKTLGYYNINDGGSATYKITSTPSLNSYYETLSNGLYAELITDGCNNIEVFGVENLDITNAIDNAIKYSNQVNFLNKKYLCRKTIQIDKTITLKGYNNSRGSTQPTITFEGIALSNDITCINIHPQVTGLILENFNIKGEYTKVNQAKCTGIYFSSNAYHGTLRNIQVYGCETGILLSRSWNFLFDNVIVDSCKYGLDTSGTVTSTTFNSCVIYSCDIGIRFRAGVVYTTLTSTGFDHCDTGIRMEGSGSIAVVNCGWEDFETAISLYDEDNVCNVYGGYFMRSEGRTRYELSGAGKFNLFGIDFDENAVFNTTYHMNCHSCTNLSTSAQVISDGKAYNKLITFKNGYYTRLLGTLHVTSGKTLTLKIDKTQSTNSIIGNINVVNSTGHYNWSFGTTGSHYYDSNRPNFVTVTYSNYILTITFNESCFIDTDVIFRGFDFV